MSKRRHGLPYLMYCDSQRKPAKHGRNHRVSAGTDRRYHGIQHMHTFAVALLLDDGAHEHLDRADIAQLCVALGMYSRVRCLQPTSLAQQANQIDHTPFL